MRRWNMPDWPDLDYIAKGLIILFLFGSPVIGYAVGFYAGTIRLLPLRVIVAFAAIVLPLAALISPLLIPGSSESSRFAAGMGLVVLGAPLALWMLLATVGAFKGAAWRRDGNA
jgi:hypothetical protein